MIDSDKEDRWFKGSSGTGTARGDSVKDPVEGAVYGTREEMEKKFLLPPPLFKHRDLTKISNSSPRIAKQKLTNSINHLNFTDGYLWAHLRDPRYEEDVFIHAYPEPCMGETITCRWSKENTTGFEYHRFLNLVLDDGMSVILVPVKLLNINSEGFTIEMPEAGYVLGKRQARRFPCQGITADISQSGFLARGELLDFSALSFRIRVAPCLDGSFHWLNTDEPITLTLCQGQKIIFADPCRFIDQTSSMSVKDIVLAPLMKQFHRFRGRKMRSPRVQLAPSSSINFEHPLSGKRVQRDIHDISVGGFSVHERNDESVLIPGMIIHTLRISYSGTLAIPCTAQVMYRRKGKGELFRCGLAILDMNASTYGKLSNVLGNVLDPCLHVSDEISMDALWEFFFKTGFLYPKKYRSIESHKNALKETYRKLYQASPEISTHVTYQKNGDIYGHAAIMRAYERTWMVHHLAARPMPGVTSHTGLNVLKQLLNYYDGLHHLPSVKMDYMMFYFRPENRFPNLFFGGFARDLNNASACSMDLFAYKNYSIQSPRNTLPDKWSLRGFSSADSYSLERSYRNQSGGLMLRALDLGQEHSGTPTLKELYKSHGLTRDWKVYSLAHAHELKAVLVVNQSDLGLNLSDLLNGIKIIITDPTGLPWDILSSAIDRLTGIYTVDSIPVLVYPHTYLEGVDVPYEKQYYAWVMDTQYGRRYLEYMKDRTRIKLRFILKFLVKRYLKR
ncbi:MAG: PilZ domain-containing protein [Syntrophales bacterium]|nr:PilZ domain-containing protein [Syntrophales bacterium]